MFSFWTAQNAQYKNKELMEKGIPLNSPKSSIRVRWKLRCLICSPMTAMAYKFIIIKNHCPRPLVGYVMHIIYHLHDSGLLSISINFLTNENWGNFNELNLSCNILAHTYASASTAMKMVASSRLLIRFINDMVGARTTNWFITLNCLTTLLVAISYVCAGRAMLGHVDLLRECMCWLLFNASLVLFYCATTTTIGLGFLIRKKKTHIHTDT